MLKEVVRAKDVEFPRSVKPSGAVEQLELVGLWDGGDPAAGCVYG